MRHRHVLLVPGLVLGLALGTSACGDDPSAPARTAEPSTPEATPEATPDATPRPTPRPTPGGPVTEPTPREKRNGQGSTTTVTGVVVAGVEAGCLLLDTGSESLLLVGARPEDVPVDARVRVTGSREPDQMTTCQQGVPFRVLRVSPAGD